MSPFCRFLVVCLLLALFAPARGETPRSEPTDLLGDPLPAPARLRLGTVRFRHGAGIGALAFSPDGRLLASLSRDRSIRLWQANTGKLIHHFQEPDIEFHALVFSPNSKVLAGAGGDAGKGNHAIRLWDVASGKETRRLTGHRHAIQALAFTPDGQNLISVSCAQTIRWDMATGKELSQWQQQGPAGPRAFAPDRTTLAALGPFNAINVLDTATGKERMRLIGMQHGAQALAYSAAGTMLAATNPFEPLRIWDLTTGLAVNPPARTFPVDCVGVALAFSPDGAVLASAGLNGTIRLWDTATAKELRRLVDYQGWTNGLCFTPDGKTLAVAGADTRTIPQWDVASGNIRPPPAGHHGQVHAIAFSHDGAILASGGGENADGQRAVRLWDTAGGKELGQIQAPGRVNDLKFSPVGRTLASAGEADAIVHLWDAITRKEIGQLGKQPEPKAPETDYRVTALAFAADGKTLAAGCSDRILRLWDVATSKERIRLGRHDGPITTLAFSPDGKLLGSAGHDRTVRLWNVAEGKELRRLPEFEDVVRSIAFSPDGKLLAVGCGDWQGQISLWEVSTGKKRRQFPSDQARLFQLAFSPDGRTLAAGYCDNSLRLWEIATGQERRRFHGHAGPVHAVAFSPDGQTLASGSADTTALIWDVTPRGMGIKNCKLSRTALHFLWSDLGSEDAARAGQAVAILAACSKQAVPFLQARLRSQEEAVTADRLERLLADLGHDRFQVRQEANAELLRLGDLIESALRQELQTAPSLEVRRRLELVLRHLECDSFCLDRVRAARAREAIDWSAILRR